LATVNERYPDTQVVVITSYSGEAGPSEAIAAGASHFITKPFKNVEITRTLDSLIARKKRVRQ
jgi:DNA-binding NarL/FixJ family response regulator